MAEQDDLQLLGRTFASVADTESAVFARELARVLAALERDLLGMVAGVREKNRSVLVRAGRLLRMRMDIRNALKDAGYQTLVTRATIDAVDRMAAVARESRLIAAASRLGTLSPDRLRVLAQVMRQDLLGVGDTLAVQLWRAAALAVYSNRPSAAIVASLAKVFEKSRAQAQTLFDTSVSVLGRQIVAAEPKESDEQAYLYVGPVDGVVREWCLEHLGKVYTKDQIEALDNGQIPNPFLSGGGYNCRHSWMAVSDPALKAIVNTGERAPGFAERVSVARQFKVSQRGARRVAA